MTRRPMTLTNLAQLGRFDATARFSNWTARVKWAAIWRRNGRWHVTGQDDSLPLGGRVEDRDG